MSQAITCCTDVICGSSPHTQLLPTAAILTRFHCHSDRCHCHTESAWVSAAFVVDGRRVTISTRVGGCIRFLLCPFHMNNQLIRMADAKHTINVMHFSNMVFLHVFNVLTFCHGHDATNVVLSLLTDLLLDVPSNYRQREDAAIHVICVGPAPLFRHR